jgi:fermentation-respiration switch protein FrsA (DUF1100 family)
VFGLERSFLYFPDRVPGATPADVGLAGEELAIQTVHGVRLHGYWLPGRAQRVLVWYPGNAGNLSHRLPHARLLHDRFGLDQVLADYRGYGRSQGQPSETGLYRDGLALFAATLARGFRPEQVVLFGASLGAAVAIEVARQQPVGAVILETPFLSIPALARVLYPWLPPALIRSRFDNAAKIGQVSAPKLIVHGDRDELVPRAVVDLVLAGVPLVDERQDDLDHALRRVLVAGQLRHDHQVDVGAPALVRPNRGCPSMAALQERADDARRQVLVRQQPLA